MGSQLSANHVAWSPCNSLRAPCTPSASNSPGNQGRRVGVCGRPKRKSAHWTACRAVSASQTSTGRPITSLHGGAETGNMGVRRAHGPHTIQPELELSLGPLLFSSSRMKTCHFGLSSTAGGDPPRHSSITALPAATCSVQSRWPLCHTNPTRLCWVAVPKATANPLSFSAFHLAGWKTRDSLSQFFLQPGCHVTRLGSLRCKGRPARQSSGKAFIFQIKGVRGSLSYPFSLVSSLKMEYRVRNRATILQT